MPTAYDFTMDDIDGKPVDLSQYRGRVCLFVNVASRCGFTPQYQGLEALWREYKNRGLLLLGFPSNDFLWQEPGNGAAIKQFCTGQYDVTFPLFSKIHVRGRKQHPLYATLSEKTGSPRWNFHKYLVGKDGNVFAAFKTRVEPGAPELRTAIETALSA